MFRVYSLSRDGGPVRYVGTATGLLRDRVAVHVSRALWRPTTAKDLWVADVARVGGAIALRELERVNEPAERGNLDAAEARWIARMLLDGRDLLNEQNVERAHALVGLPHPAVCEAGAALWRVLDRRRLTFKDAARELGVTLCCVGNWCSGIAVPRGAVRERLAAWLGDEMTVDLFRAAHGVGKPTHGRPFAATSDGRRAVVEQARASRRSARATGSAS